MDREGQEVVDGSILASQKVCQLMGDTRAMSRPLPTIYIQPARPPLGTMTLQIDTDKSSVEGLT